MDSIRRQCAAIAVAIVAAVTPMVWPQVPIAVGLIAYAVAALLILYAIHSWLSEKTRRPLVIAFPGIASTDDREGDHYTVTSVMPQPDGKPDGGPINTVPILRRVFLVVRNGSPDRTIDEVCVKVATAGFGRPPQQSKPQRRLRPRRPRMDSITMQPVDFALPSASDGSAKVSIAPNGEERFALLTVIDKDSSPVGNFHTWAPQGYVDKLLAMHEAQNAYIGPVNSGKTVLRNDRIEMEIVVTGRDTKPSYGRIFADLRTVFRVSFREAKSLD